MSLGSGADARLARLTWLARRLHLDRDLERLAPAAGMQRPRGRRGVDVVPAHRHPNVIGPGDDATWRGRSASGLSFSRVSGGGSK
jgi:hypothetical protein